MAFVTKPDKCCSSGVHSLGLSDHNLIYITRKNKKVKSAPRITKSHSFKNFNDIDYIDSIKNVNWDLVTNCTDVDQAWMIWKHLFNEVCNLHAPIKQKRVSTSLPEWINSDYIKLSKDRDYYYAKAHKTNDDEDWFMAKSLRNKVNNLSRTLKRKYCTDAINNNKSNSKKLWETIKKLIPKNTSSVQSVKADNGLTKCDKDTANQFNDYFTSIGTTLADKFDNDLTGNINSSENDCSNLNSTFNFDIVTPEFIFDEICNFANNKSSGLDGINVKLLKLAAPIICNSLAYICNLSLCTSVFPSDWKQAKVTPVFKEGDKSDVSNYRPISVLSIVSKILERAVHNQLYTYLTNCNILNQYQSGFRSNHSTATTLLDVSDYILNNMNDGKVTAAVFLDLKKAFDTVNHEILLSKLYSYGVRGNTLSWFRSYLDKRSQVVNINSTLSDCKGINVGIPQGSILGPLLFIIYVNSLPNSVTSKVVMYADDTTLLCSSDDPVSLQSELDDNLCRIADWFNTNKLTLNIKKTKFMIFGSNHTVQNFDQIHLRYNNVDVEKVDSFKYLGVTFDSKMSWTCHVDHICKTVSKRIGVIRKVKYYLPPCTLKLLANSLVMPHFDYCSSVWSNCNADLLNSLQVHHNRLARVLTGADIRTHIDDLMNSLNWIRLNERWNSQLLILLFKCLKETAPMYLSSQFNFTQSIHSHGTRSQTFNALVIPSWKAVSGKRTFHYRAVKLWNDLPNDVRGNFDSMSLQSFKHNI